MLERERLIALIGKIADCDGSEAEIDEALEQLDRLSPMSGASDLIFHHDPELTPEQIADRLLTYRPTPLHRGPIDPQDPHYLAIVAHYGERTAARSGVKLIRHIDEGLAVLLAIGAPLRAMQGYCLHPLLQDDASLSDSLLPDSTLYRYAPDPGAVALAMEYRSVANAYLSQHCTGPDDDIALSPLTEVNQMLIADKVQNRKDFERYHLGTHPRSEVLAQYFANWLRALGVGESRYRLLCEQLARHDGPAASCLA
ncbi:hypothetical protein SAMN04487939_102399 [Lysobacter sp. yr284]|uniref:hypothetical protein n=1 Tax=Lysobacter sp. yr284 TaxID=1761791 RepID=UPI000895159B|nr:hypothetical protein [Lysobacter sp. yr284]SDY49522.1 hypothetical protein SAMN04487939_102399 [Lysobacter sp. yr284]